MKKVLFSFLLFFIFAPVLQASPAPKMLAINEDTQQCGEYFLGDECFSCRPVNGWKILGWASNFNCPTNYKNVDKVPTECNAYKNSFCCTIAHSGADGNCKDVVVNNQEKKCAFVKNIDECKTLPKNWEKSNACPSVEHEWLEGFLKCESQNIQTNQNIKETDLNDNKQLNIIWLVIAVGLAVVLLIVLFKKNNN